MNAYIIKMHMLINESINIFVAPRKTVYYITPEMSRDNQNTVRINNKYQYDFTCHIYLVNKYQIMSQVNENTLIKM